MNRIGVGSIEQHTVALAERVNRGPRVQGARVLTPLSNRSSIVAFAADPTRDPAGLFAKANTDVSAHVARSYWSRESASKPTLAEKWDITGRPERLSGQKS